MTDQELRKIAERVRVNLTNDSLACESENECYEECLSDWKARHSDIIQTALAQVRDAQENKIAILEANEAVQHVLIADLESKVNLAVDVLERVQYLLGEKDFSLIGEALEKIKGSK